MHAFRLSFVWSSNWQYSGIGSDNGLAPTRRQTIIWTNDGLSYRRIHALFGLNVLASVTSVWNNSRLPNTDENYHIELGTKVHPRVSL